MQKLLIQIELNGENILVGGFPEALKMASEKLRQQGFDGIEEIYEQILRTG
jgi:hypothetical protein